MTLTLEDIARLSGVSRSTVSRVINGDEKVSEETKRKVLDIVKEHHFQPNIAARRLAAGKTNVLGLIIPSNAENIFNDLYFSRIIQGFSSECNTLEYAMMLWLAEANNDHQLTPKIPGQGLIDGVVVSAPLIDDPILSIIEASGLPCVLVGHHPASTLNCIDIDNIQAAHLATNHLLTCSGFRTRPATIAGPRESIAGRDRLLGYAQALKNAGLPYDSELVIECDFSETSGYYAMQALLAKRPDCVFAASDLMATGAYRAIRERGLRIPDDITIIGFDDLTMAAQLDPALTTVRQPVQKIGAKAVSMLVNLLQKPGGPIEQYLIEPELIIRSSCGCQESTGYHFPSKDKL